MFADEFLGGNVVDTSWDLEPYSRDGVLTLRLVDRQPVAGAERRAIVNDLADAPDLIIRPLDPQHEEMDAPGEYKPESQWDPLSRHILHWFTYFLEPGRSPGNLRNGEFVEVQRLCQLAIRLEQKGIVRFVPVKRHARNGMLEKVGLKTSDVWAVFANDPGCGRVYRERDKRGKPQDPPVLRESEPVSARTKQALRNLLAGMQRWKELEKSREQTERESLDPQIDSLTRARSARQREKAELYADCAKQFRKAMRGKPKAQRTQVCRLLSEKTGGTTGFRTFERAAKKAGYWDTCGMDK